jgi:hypothetical protein
MATGIEMMVSALLKAVGFSREQFDGTLSTVKTEFDAMKSRAVNAEESLAAVMRGQVAIMKHFGIAPETDDARQGVLHLVAPVAEKEETK